MSVTNKPQIEAYIGSSGSGKGVSIKARLKTLKEWPLIIWDPRDEYGDFAKQTSMDGIVEACRKIKRGGVPMVRYVHDGKSPLEEAFATVCALAFTTGNLVFLAEELSDVTTASRAPPEWKRVITQGRHQGLLVMGAAQRPALIDKTFLGNCTYVRCFTLRYAMDRKAMAQAMDVDIESISELETTDDETTGRVTINYLERDFRSKLLQNGVIKLKRKG